MIKDKSEFISKLVVRNDNYDDEYYDDYEDQYDNYDYARDYEHKISTCRGWWKQIFFCFNQL